MTAVEWLAEQILHPNIFNPYIEQAKEMEKKQMKEMYLKGIENYDPTFKNNNNEKNRL
jgi:hypothetical protein